MAVAEMASVGAVFFLCILGFLFFVGVCAIIFSCDAVASQLYARVYQGQDDYLAEKTRYYRCKREALERLREVVTVSRDSSQTVLFDPTPA
jgi:hypothetical protein